MLVAHVVENYSSLLDQVNYVQTFRALRARYEQHQDRLKDRHQGIDSSVPGLLRNSGTSRFRRDPRQMDEEEEMWFNDDDEMDDGDSVVPASNSPEMVIRKSPDAELDSIGMPIFHGFSFVAKLWVMNVLAPRYFLVFCIDTLTRNNEL